MSTDAQQADAQQAPQKLENPATPDDQLRRELQLLIQRHAEFSRRLETILTELQGVRQPAAVAPQAAAGPVAAEPVVSERTTAELARLSERLSRMEDHMDTVNRQIGVNSGRIQEILESRTWKAITGMGGILLRLLGRH